MDSRRSAAFRLLGIPADSDREAVAQAYHRLARLTHPDVSADPEAAQLFTALTAAYRLACEVPQPEAETAPSERPPAPTRSETLADPVAADWIWSSGVAAQMWPRPPIVAGPVRIRPSTRAAGGEGRDG